MGLLINLAAVNRAGHLTSGVKAAGAVHGRYRSTGEILRVLERKARWYHHQGNYRFRLAVRPVHSSDESL